MIRTLLLTLGLGASSLSSCDTLSNLPGTISNPSSTTQDEASTGIRQALSNGIASAIANLGRENGFFGDQIYKVLLPPDAVKIESTLRNIGIGVDVLPENIRNSKVLTGNDLGMLGNVEQLPEIDPAFDSEDLKKIVQYYSLNPDDMEREIHTLAHRLLQEGKVTEAWQVLLS